jgi:hypothetical protein
MVLEKAFRPLLESLRKLRRRKIFLASILDDALLDFRHVNKDGAPSVDLTVKLDMLVVLAVFTFVGAVLLGAF